MLAGGCRAVSCPQRLVVIKCDFKCRDSCKNGGDAFGGCPADSRRKGLFQAKCDSECRRICCKGVDKTEYDLQPRDICSKAGAGDAGMLAGSCHVDSCPLELFMIKCDSERRDIYGKDGGDGFGGCPADLCPKGLFQANCDSECRHIYCTGFFKARCDLKPGTLAARMV